MPRQYLLQGAGRLPSASRARSAIPRPRSDLLSTITSPGASAPPPGVGEVEVERAALAVADERDACVTAAQRGRHRRDMAEAVAEERATVGVEASMVARRHRLAQLDRAVAGAAELDLQRADVGVRVQPRPALVAAAPALHVCAEAVQVVRVEVGRVVGEGAPAGDLECRVRRSRATPAGVSRRPSRAGACGRCAQRARRRPRASRGRSAGSWSTSATAAGGSPLTMRPRARAQARVHRAAAGGGR